MGEDLGNEIENETALATGLLLLHHTHRILIRMFEIKLSSLNSPHVHDSVANARQKPDPR